MAKFVPSAHSPDPQLLEQLAYLRRLIDQAERQVKAGRPCPSWASDQAIRAISAMGTLVNFLENKKG